MSMSELCYKTTPSDSLSSIQAGYAVQETLSQAQGIPVFGPLIASPFRFVVSLVQTVAAAIFTLIFYALSRVANNDFLPSTKARVYQSPEAMKSTGYAAFFDERMNQAHGHVVVGFYSMISSVSNIFSGGKVGYEVEKEKQKILI